MKPARLIVLGIALSAGLLAAWLSAGRKPAEPAAPQIVQAPRMETVDVLISSSAIELGRVVTAGEMRWQPWPIDAATALMIRRNDTPNALEELVGSIARIAMIEGEPIRKEKLVKPDGSGFMATILPTGQRALAISIDTVGRNSAGGFILPNDRVDVVRTYRDDQASKTSGTEIFRSETVLTNMRVLAIGQNIQEKNGERVVVGETATLELNADQVETVTLAQKTSTISLALRSLVDRNQSAEPARENTTNLTVVRFGVATTVTPR